MRIIASFAVVLSMIVMMSTTVQAQPHIAESLLIHLDLDLDASAIAPTNIQVKIHASDHYNDSYFASPIDPEEGSTVDWTQDLPIMTSNNVPMRLIFHISDTTGAPLPAGYTVDWTMSGDTGEQSGNTFLLPADTSGDMNLSVQGSVVSQ